MENEEHQGLSHVMPVKTLLTVFGALMVLTVITVAAATVDLGAINLTVALLIAVVKASLVALFFMHLKYDKKFNSLVLVSALVFLGVFLFFALLDTTQYQDAIEERDRDTRPGIAQPVGPSLPKTAPAAPEGAE